MAISIILTMICDSDNRTAYANAGQVQYVVIGEEVKFGNTEYVAVDPSTSY